MKKHSYGFFWIWAIMEIAREMNLLLNFSDVNRFLCTNVLLTVRARDMDHKLDEDLSITVIKLMVHIQADASIYFFNYMSCFS